MKLQSLIRPAALVLTAVCAVSGQTLINLGTQARNIDFSSEPFTRPEKTGTTLPSTCSVGYLFFNTAAPAGQNLYGCVSTNTWNVLSGGGGNFLTDPGANGIVVRTAPNTTTAVAAPVGTVVGTTDTQTLTNKSIDASEIATGTFASARMPAFTGDVITSAGSTVTTLTTVNSSPGTYGDSAHSLQITVDGKGRVTSVTPIAITGGGGSGGAGITTGTLASLPSSCTTGTLYFATDQAPGQQIYTCSSSNTWTQVVSLGGSGALAFTNGSLDIVTTVVPRLPAANTFSGLNTFLQPPVIPQSTPANSSAACNAGAIWADSNYMYVCTATNTIKRSALSSF